MNCSDIHEILGILFEEYKRLTVKEKKYIDEAILELNPFLDDKDAYDVTGNSGFKVCKNIPILIPSLEYLLK